MQVLLLVLLPLVVTAQETKRWSGFGIETHLLAGKVFKHEAKFTLPIPALTSGFDVNFVQHTYGRRVWEQGRHFPRLGVAITGIQYGIDAVYGNVIGVYPNITFPIVSGKRIEWTLRAGNGIGYVTNQYSRANPVNTTNVAIGSKVNDFIMILSDAGYEVNKHWQIKAGAFITHISNGSVRKPNLGINVVGMGAGVSYFPVTAHPTKIARPLQPLSQRYLLQLRYGMSLVSANTPGGPLFPVYTGTGYVSRRWRNHNKGFAGIDYSYHQNLYAHLRDNGLEQGRERQHAYKCAVLAGNEFLLGRVGIMVQAGVYIKKGYLQKEDVYEKVSFNYYCVQRERGPVKELYLFTSLKAHLNVAEMGEMGVGIGF
ncbi:MAG: acyloxyacyl hydrolase [Taibaiella sp.]|nr:acyloxyacyl hydrolase [Taibaiella sp.]